MGHSRLSGSREAGQDRRRRPAGQGTCGVACRAGGFDDADLRQFATSGQARCRLGGVHQAERARDAHPGFAAAQGLGRGVRRLHRFDCQLEADLAADAAVPGVAVADTIKRVDAEGRVVETPQRATLVAVQTPQAFRAEVLREAHALGKDATDDAALVEENGGRVVVVAGEPTNRKITDREDLAWARDTAVRDGR